MNPFQHAAASVAPPGTFYHSAAVPIPLGGVPVRQVWAVNLDAEMDMVQAFATRAIHVAVSVQYPGVVHGHGDFHHQERGALAAEKRYAVLKANVDALKPLQLGLAVVRDDGWCTAWEFNLRGFDPESDPHAASSVAYLAARGMDFEAHRNHGISLACLSMELHHRGLLQRQGVSWITYVSAYHLAYFVKIVTGGAPLPGDIAGFLALVREFLYGDVYDVARIAADRPWSPVGLERLAAALGLPPPLVSPRLGGGRAVLALQAFLKLGRSF